MNDKITRRRVSETQQHILEALNTYRFLSANQLMRLGICPTKNTAYKNCSALMVGKALIDYADFGRLVTYGRLPRLYYLKKPGAQWLAAMHQVDESEINYPKGVKIFSQDHPHRVATINVHIEARTFAESIEGMHFDFFHAYFEHTGANYSPSNPKPKRQARAKIELQDGYFIPDCNFKMTDPNGKEWLFTAEIYRNHTTLRTFAQAEKHLKALVEGAISKHYQCNVAARVLFVCEDERAMCSLMKRIKDDGRFEHAENYFLFKTTDALTNNFPKGWLSFTGRDMNAFQV